MSRKGPECRRNSSVLVPLVEMLALSWILLPLCRGQGPAAFVLIFRGLRLVRPWAMVEVFILGVITAAGLAASNGTGRSCSLAEMREKQPEALVAGCKRSGN